MYARVPMRISCSSRTHRELLKQLLPHVVEKAVFSRFAQVVGSAFLFVGKDNSFSADPCNQKAKDRLHIRATLPLISLKCISSRSAAGFFESIMAPFAVLVGVFWLLGLNPVTVSATGLLGCSPALTYASWSELHLSGSSVAEH